MVRGRNNVQRAPLIQLPVWAGTRRKDYEIHGRPWGLRLRPLSGCHSPDVATKLSTKYWRTWQNKRGKKTRQLNLHPLKLLVGVQVGGMHLKPKDSNAMVGVRDCATGKALEGADKQTDFLRITVRCSQQFSRCQILIRW